MAWLMTMREHLPFLLVLSPAIGFLVTLAAAATAQDLVRHLAVSNTFCTLLILGGAFWQFESDMSDEIETRRLLAEEAASSGSETSTLEMMYGMIDRQHAERVGQRWLVVDGTNLWPIFTFVVISGVVFWRIENATGNLNWLFPNAILFQAASLVALMSYDLRVYLIAFGTGVLAMSAMIGQWGGPDRRVLAGRYMLAQFCGGSFVMLGFAMLIVAVPWMKMEDSPKLPSISFHIARIVYEIQKWTSGNELAFQYRNEVFPWMLFLLSLGFAIQFGLFPFHSWQLAIFSSVPCSIVVLFVAGSLSTCGMGWLRFVVPLAPDVLAAFDWLILIPSLGGAVWGSLRALVTESPRQRAAFVFLSLLGLSLLGCFSLTRAALSGTWLMQQQLIIMYCAAFFALSPSSRLNNGDQYAHNKKPLEDGGSATKQFSAARQAGFDNKSDSTNLSSESRGLKTRTLLLLCCVPLTGFFASIFIIFSELIRESLLLVALAFVVGALNLLTIYSLLTGYALDERLRNSASTNEKWFRGSIAVVLLLAVFVSFFPNQMLRQCEPDFLRVFRRFERLPSKAHVQTAAMRSQIR